VALAQGENHCGNGLCADTCDAGRHGAWRCAIRNIGNKSAEQTLLLLCEAGQKTWTRILKAWSSLSKSELWEQVDVARGLAVYDPKEDESVNDVVRRADKLMYDHKWNRKRNVT